ncbi:hypothetical protein ACROYT_G010201 [Oculina patagonica]
MFLPSSPHQSSVCAAKVELAFLIDGSGSIDKSGLENFRRTLSVVKKIASGFEVSTYGVHVGVIVFSTGPRVVSGLNKHHYDRSSVLEAIAGIRYPGGRRNIGVALDFARNKLYHESDRHGLPKMLIIFTRGGSQDPIAAAAQRLRDSGVTIFSVGVGNYDIQQLRVMATDPDSKHVYKVDFNDLDALATSIKYRVCRVCRAKLDLAILIDASQSVENFADRRYRISVQFSKQLAVRNYQRSLQFIKQLVSGFNIAKEGTHVGIVVFARDAKTVFGFEKYFNIWTMLKAIDNIKHPQRGTFIGKGLDAVRTQLFDASARQGVPRILLVVTDSASQDDVDQPSKRLRDMGVTVLSLGVGREYDVNQLNAMATDPDHDHVFTSDFSHLHSSLVEKIKDKVCTSGGIIRADDVTNFGPQNEKMVDDENSRGEMIGEGGMEQQFGSNEDEETAFEEEDREKKLDRKNFGEGFGTYATPDGLDYVEGSSITESERNGVDSRGGYGMPLLPSGKAIKLRGNSPQSLGIMMTGGDIRMRSTGEALRPFRNSSDIEGMETASNAVPRQGKAGRGMGASEMLDEKESLSEGGKPDTPSVSSQGESSTLDSYLMNEDKNLLGEGIRRGPTGAAKKLSRESEAPKTAGYAKLQRESPDRATGTTATPDEMENKGSRSQTTYSRGHF